jgi:hypothetical protein
VLVQPLAALPLGWVRRAQPGLVRRGLARLALPPCPPLLKPLVLWVRLGQALQVWRLALLPLWPLPRKSQAAVLVLPRLPLLPVSTP